MDLVFCLRPLSKLVDSNSILEIEVDCDADWAGCLTTRKSTSGFILFLLGAAVQMGARTQLIFAMSSGESELYAIGTVASEALHVKNFLLEAKVCRGVKILINTDSSAAKSMASRFGVSKKTRHV